MDLQSVIFGSVGGLAIFLFGMNFMSEGLRMVGSRSFKTLLHSLTKKRGSAVLVGMGITCLIQSSSATSVMVVGFVNAGLLKLTQAIAVVLGADIGTTITAWIVSVMGIGKIKITAYALPIIAIGFLIYYVSRKRRRKMIGQTILGFGLLFLGLGTMSEGVRSVQESQMVLEFFESFGRNPFLGIIAGTLVTVVIQSSSATIAIVQVMAFQNLFGLEAALPLMFGADIGTTITAQLAALGGTRGARAVAMSNSVFKLCGAALFLPLLVTGVLESMVTALISSDIDPASGTNRVVMAQIAVAHSAYIAVNVLIFSTLLWAPLVRFSSWLARIRDDEESEEETRYLDPILLDSPPVALEQCYKEVAYMTRLARKNFDAGFTSFMTGNLDAAEEIENRENRIDEYQNLVTGYLVDLSRRQLSSAEGRVIPRLIHAINDAERVGDRAEALVGLTELAQEKKLAIPPEAERDLRACYDLVNRQFEAVIHALLHKDVNSVSDALDFENQLEGRQEVMYEKHVTRLDNGNCTVHTSVIVMDVVSNLEKMARNLSNIAVRIELEEERAPVLNR